MVWSRLDHIVMIACYNLLSLCQMGIKEMSGGKIYVRLRPLQAAQRSFAATKPCENLTSLFRATSIGLILNDMFACTGSCH